jgi:hypothetical protein
VADNSRARQGQRAGVASDPKTYADRNCAFESIQNEYQNAKFATK